MAPKRGKARARAVNLPSEIRQKPWFDVMKSDVEDEPKERSPRSLWFSKNILKVTDENVICGNPHLLEYNLLAEKF